MIYKKYEKKIFWIYLEGCSIDDYRKTLSGEPTFYSDKGAERRKYPFFYSHGSPGYGVHTYYDGIIIRILKRFL